MAEFWKNATAVLTTIASSIESLVQTLFTPINDTLYEWADGADLPDLAITALNFLTYNIPDDLTLIGFALGAGLLTWLVLTLIKWVIGIVM